MQVTCPLLSHLPLEQPLLLHVRCCHSRLLLNVMFPWPVGLHHCYTCCCCSCTSCCACICPCSCCSISLVDWHLLLIWALLLGVVQGMMDRERENASNSVARERACAAAAERDAESACSRADACKRQLQRDLDNAHSEVHFLSRCLRGCWVYPRVYIPVLC